MSVGGISRAREMLELVALPLEHVGVVVKYVF